MRYVVMRLRLRLLMYSIAGAPLAVYGVGARRLLFGIDFNGNLVNCALFCGGVSHPIRLDSFGCRRPVSGVFCEFLKAISNE